MTLHRQTLSRFSALGPLQFEAIAATDALCDDGFALDMQGGNISRLTSGKANLLWSHDRDEIIGRIETAWFTAHELMVRARFASEGISQIADQTRRMLKDGIINSLSLTFTVEQSERMQGGGRRATKWTAYEASLCAIPCDPQAVVTSRALFRTGKVLSGANSEKLRAAHDAAEMCRSHIADVLDGAGATAPPSANGNECRASAWGSKDYRQRQIEALRLRGDSNLADMGIDPVKCRTRAALDYELRKYEARELRRAR